ncbi:hypothetical protein SKAU_G00306230 [Synaphobranchus kaupii]|uniref:Uncharacterized protein n=1 Tax=Synaphobranchus kaupii TaxID=118154 RepID=A0A9Q1EQN3_SYNKA|nr:hypothetical protein SKAU_G00306230 [Synaphobranchus kaupii]
MGRRRSLKSVLNSLPAGKGKAPSKSKASYSPVRRCPAVGGHAALRRESTGNRRARRPPSAKRKPLISVPALFVIPTSGLLCPPERFAALRIPAPPRASSVTEAHFVQHFRVWPGGPAGRAGAQRLRLGQEQQTELSMTEGNMTGTAPEGQGPHRAPRPARQTMIKRSFQAADKRDGQSRGPPLINRYCRLPLRISLRHARASDRLIKMCGDGSGSSPLCESVCSPYRLPCPVF